ncbi:MAG: hypothetical protein J6Z01_12830 [Bacteroidales bacterium]|nr:hypothetical protein [Bacteroidales bacterium]
MLEKNGYLSGQFFVIMDCCGGAIIRCEFSKTQINTDNIVLKTIFHNVPQITITADGNALTIPSQPIFFTNFNGYYECNHYQVYGPITDKSTLKVDSDIKSGMKISISKITDGRATIRAEYNGKEKVFLIN